MKFNYQSPVFAVAAVALSAFSTLAITGHALADEAPEYVNIKSIAYGGSGCPQDTVGKMVSSDRQSFTLLFDEFIVEAGPGIDASKKRKNCQLAVDLEFPQGWTYSVMGFDYRGYADLDQKVSARIKSNYYFQGSDLNKTFESKLNGQLQDDYTVTDTFGVDAIVYAPCGVTKPLNINTEIFVDNSAKRSKYGLMTVDSLDGSVQQKYRLQWKRCHNEEIKPPVTPPDHLPGLAPAGVKIKAISHGGSGCPQGSVGNLVSSDGTAFTLIYDQFITEIGPGVSRRENRKFCQLTVDLEYPAGWTFTVATLDSRGFADLDDSVTGLNKTSYYWQGATEDVAFESKLRGVYADNYKIRDMLAIDAVYAPCSERKPLNIKTDISLSSTTSSGSGLLTVDSTDGALHQVYGLHWTRCN